jgi:hypothetical protein
LVKVKKEAFEMQKENLEQTGVPLSRLKRQTRMKQKKRNETLHASNPEKVKNHNENCASYCVECESREMKWKEEKK